MGISKIFKAKLDNFNTEEADRLVRLGWEDRSTFEAIRIQFGLSPNEFVHFMRKKLTSQAFRRWRRRVFEQGHLKNEKQRGFVKSRFKCTRQSVDGVTKGWK